MGEFVLRIKLGNAAMSTPEDVAVALRDLADRLERVDQETGAVFDGNGNRVGSWTLEGQLP